MNLAAGATRAILFDLDGTLLDSYASHLRAYQGMFAHYDITLTVEELLAIHSPDWYAVFRAAGLPEQHWAEADERWLAEAATHKPELFPGAPQLLERLRSDYKLGIVTSGSSNRVWRDLRRTGIGALFEVVVTGSDVEQRKPHPEGLWIALEKLGEPPQAALYVGDTAQDCAMAAAAAVPFVGVASPVLNSADHPTCVHLDKITELESLLHS